MSHTRRHTSLVTTFSAVVTAARCKERARCMCNLFKHLHTKTSLGFKSLFFAYLRCKICLTRSRWRIDSNLFVGLLLIEQHMTMSFELWTWIILLWTVAVQAELLTSTACPSLRWAIFPARLDLFYFYLIEFDNITAPDLLGIERAIASGLMDTFQGCNAYGEPVHGVQLNERGHRYSSGSEFYQTMLYCCGSIETENPHTPPCHLSIFYRC